MNFLDESGEIRATAFKNEVDKFYDFIQLNKVQCFYYAFLFEILLVESRSCVIVWFSNVMHRCTVTYSFFCKTCLIYNFPTNVILQCQ